MREQFKMLAPLLLLMLLGAVLRWDFVTPNNFIIDSDEAIVGLMAKHILEGKGVPTFYYGQHYMGSLEALLAALSFSIFGISNVALKLVPFIFSVLLIPLVYALSRFCAPRPAALLAATLLAIPPAPLVVWSSKARGGFIEVICIGTIAFLLSFIWLRRARPSLALTILTGALLGLGWWVNNQIVFFFPAIALVFLYGTLRDQNLNRPILLLKHLLSGTIAFFIGGLPFWLYNINHDFITFEMFQSADSGTLSQHLSGLFTSALPIILGGSRFWQEEPYIAGGEILALLAYGSLLLFAIVYSSREIVRVCTLKNCQPEGQFLFFLTFIGSTVAIFTLSSFGYLVQAPRYLLPLYIGIMPLCAFSIYRLGRFIGSAMLIIVLGINLASSYLGHKAVPGEPFVYNGERVSKDHQELIDWLTEHDYSFVRTNYWIGYRLAFETREKIRFLMFENPYQIRIPEYQKAGHHLNPEQIPLVLVPSQAVIVRRALAALKIPFDDLMLSNYVVIIAHNYDRLTDLDRLQTLKVQPDEVRATAGSQNSHFAVDGDLQTRWGSGTHQQPGMEFTITPRDPILLKGIKLEMGAWSHDYPRDLTIDATLNDGSRKTLLKREDYRAIRYLQDRELLEFTVDPVTIRSITLTQRGSHPILDWSIAEFSLLY